MTRNPRPNPYVGPRSIDFGEPLYGRDAETRDLVSLLVAERIVLLHSPSGAGKTSLIQAALVPRMAQRKFFVRPVARVNRAPEQPRAAPGFNRYVFSLLSSFESAFPEAEQIPEPELASLSLADYLARRPKPPGASFELFIFDQFEEVITLNPADQDSKTEFFAQLGKLLADDTRWALFAIREDFVGTLDPYLKFIPDRFAAAFRLDLLGVKAASQALQRPVEQAGVAFDDEAARQLLDDLRQVQVQRPDGQIETQLGPYIEPVQLQVVAYRLWANLQPDDATIGLDDLRALGNVGQALGAYYAQQVERVARQAGISERSIREWFDRRLISEGSLRAQVRMGAEASAGLPNAAVRQFEDAHLIRAEKRGGVTWYELAHDRLVQPVHQDNAAWFEQHLSLLQRQAELWDLQHRPEGLLLLGKELAEAEAWAKQHPLLPVERDFLEMCRRAQRQAERERRRVWQLRFLTVAVSAAALVACVFAGAALYAFGRANEQRVTAEAASVFAKEQQVTAQAASTLAVEQRATAERASTLAVERKATAEIASTQAIEQKATAEIASTQAVAQSIEAVQQSLVSFSRELAAGALVQIQSDPRLSVLLALQAVKSTYDADGSTTYEAENALYQALQLAPYRLALRERIANDPYGSANDFNSAVFSPRGERIATAMENGAVLVWDAANGERLAALKVPTARAVAFSPDGGQIAAGSADGLVYLWNAETYRPERQLKGHAGLVVSVAYSPDGRRLVSASWDGTARVWDLRSGRELLALAGEGIVESAAFSPDGRRIVTASRAGSAVIWDAGSGKALLRLAHEGAPALSSARYSPDGRRIVTAGWDGSLHTWDAETGQPLQSWRPHTEGAYWAEYSPDGRLIASAGGEGTVYLWEAESGRRLRTLQGHSEDARHAAFSPDGQSLVTASYDGTALVWPVSVDPLLRAAEAVIARQGWDFTCEERQKYLHEEVFCPTRIP